MFRPIALALALCTALPAFAHDGKRNQYKVSFDATAQRAHVEADVWFEGNEMVLFNTMPIPALKNGQADLLENIKVSTMDGAAIAVKDKGEGEYELQGDRRLRLSYDIKLEHGKYEWPGGNEEVSYRTDEGLMSVGYALFLVPGVKMPGTTEVSFALPQGWKANTPWRSEGSKFVVESRRELCNNALFFGTARSEQFKAGGIDMTLVMGKRYWPQRDAFMKVFHTQLASYQKMFGGPPLAKRYLVVINQGDTGDGGAFSGSFSQFLKGDATPATRVLWGRVLSHELLHFWNGHAIAPTEGSEEWFKEGVTDYLTVSSMARNGLLNREELMEQLLNVPRGQHVARRLMGLTPTAREAVKEKHRNWLLVYGSGTLAALAMDVEMLKASGGKAGMPELMKAMYQEFAKPGHQGYGHADIVRLGKQVSGADLGPILEPIVGSTAVPPMEAVFKGIGLQVEQWGMLETYLLKTSDPAGKARFQRIFGTNAY
jgi:predicted metalloprotease with PDZ domain